MKWIDQNLGEAEVTLDELHDMIVTRQFVSEGTTILHIDVDTERNDMDVVGMKIRVNSWLTEANDIDCTFHDLFEEHCREHGPCKHMKVEISSRMISIQTLEEPAEYATRIICAVCGERLDEVPEGAKEKEVAWEDDFEE